ncbi:MAG: HlyD family efflux transporter periplasmic adaptor subunit [Acidimicrobiales bacterium]
MRVGSGRREQGRARARLLVGAAVMVAAVGLVARATLADTSSAASYRTAVASMGTVRQTIDRAGTIEPVVQATVAFPVSGTVASVAANVGDQVGTGQPLASLDSSGQTGDLTARQATLAAAQLTLQQALAGQSTLSGGSSSGTSTSGTTNRSSGGTGSGGAAAAATTSSTVASGGASPGRSAGGGGSGGSSSSSGADLGAAQQAVLDGQQEVDHDLRAAQAAMHGATTACSAVTTTATTTATTLPATTLPATTTTLPTAGGTGEGTVPSTGLGSATCLMAQQGALAAQQSLATAQDGLATAETALDHLLATAAGSASSASSTGSSTGSPATSGSSGSSGSTSSSSTSSSSTSSGSTSSGSSGSTSGSAGSGSSGATASTGGSSSPPSAAQLVADQAAVDAAAAAVVTAQQALDQATIVSPITGQVAAVDLAPGQQVAAASATADIVVVGPGGWEVATTVTVDDVDKVKTGDQATVVPDGTTTSIPATVVSVGVAPTTTGSTTTYPVVVGFPTSPAGLRNGASASVSIEVAHTDRALTVPTSAVRTVGAFHVVTVVSGGKPSTVTVRVGTVGVDLTEITSGLIAGQAVALADLKQALPSSNVATRAGAGLGGGGGLGGLGGGGGGAGGTGRGGG